MYTLSMKQVSALSTLGIDLCAIRCFFTHAGQCRLQAWKFAVVGWLDCM